MRTLPTLLVVGVLIFTAASAEAETRRPDDTKMVTSEPRNPILEGRGHATLTLSPMFMEIHAVNEAMAATEQDLLVRLAATQDENEVLRYVSRLERLETDRQLGVLKIRERYARLAGRYDLAFRLRQDILQLLHEENSPPM